jgi:hypothetical protein
MAALGSIQQFAPLKQIAPTSHGGYGTPLLTSNSYPFVASSASGSVPSGVATPLLPSPGSQGLTYDTAGNNKAMVTGSISYHVHGFMISVHAQELTWECPSTNGRTAMHDGQCAFYLLE